MLVGMIVVPEQTYHVFPGDPADEIGALSRRQLWEVLLPPSPDTPLPHPFSAPAVGGLASTPHLRLLLLARGCARGHGYARVCSCSFLYVCVE